MKAFDQDELDAFRDGTSESGAARSWWMLFRSGPITEYSRRRGPAVCAVVLSMFDFVRALVVLVILVINFSQIYY